jgi:hypothetical protein
VHKSVRTTKLDFRKLNCFWLKRLHLVAMFDGPSAFADIADHPAQEFTTFEMSNNPRTQFIGAVKAITMILTIQIVLKSGDATNRFRLSLALANQLLTKSRTARVILLPSKPHFRMRGGGGYFGSNSLFNANAPAFAGPLTL